MSPKVRDDRIEQWRREAEARVLLFTSIGAIGLNLTEACNVIHAVSNGKPTF